MRRALILASAAILAFASATSYADTVFNLQGTLQDGTGTFTGTLTYLPQYQSFGKVTGTITDGAFSFTVPANYLGETLNEGAATHVDVFSVGANYDLSLFVPNSILVGNAGGALCALSTPCTGFSASSFGDYDLSGNAIFATQSFRTLTATLQPTPEPASFLLLGTGIAAAASLRRRYSPRLR